MSVSKMQLSKTILQGKWKIKQTASRTEKIKTEHTALSKMFLGEYNITLLIRLNRGKTEV